MTGFTDMVTVEKAYQRMSVEGCEFIAKGANGAVYRYNDETILKTYFAKDALPEIKQERYGASAVILSPIASKEAPRYKGLEEVCKFTNTYLRIFGKPTTRKNRRMGVVVSYAPNGRDLDALRDKCKAAAAKVKVY